MSLIQILLFVYCSTNVSCNVLLPPYFSAEELEVLEADCAKFAARLGLKSEEGFRSQGASPKAGWFISWKIPGKKWMIYLGVPQIPGNLQKMVLLEGDSDDKSMDLEVPNGWWTNGGFTNLEVYPIFRQAHDIIYLKALGREGLALTESKNDKNGTKQNPNTRIRLV